MPQKDFIVKYAGDSKSYQSAMEQATRSLDKYQRQNLSTSAAMNTVTSALSRYISVAALAKGAQEALTATIRGSQTTSDAFDASITSAKTAVETFFSSLATGDFSQFNLGLENLINRSREAYDALDRLGNASISWGYFQTARMADLTELQATARDTSLPMSARQAAADQMRTIQSELQQYADAYEQTALEAMARKLTEATHLDWTDVGRADLENVLRLDLLSRTNSQAEKDRLAAQYQEYLQKVKGLTPVKAYQYTVNGMVVSNEDMQDRQRYDAELKAIAKDYQDAILYHEALERKSDEWLQSLIQIVQQADNAARSMRRVNSAVQQTENLQTPGTPRAATTTSTSAAPRYMSPLEYDRLIAQERLKIAEQYSEDWVALQQQLREIQYQMDVERLTATIQDEEQLAAALRLIEQNKQKDLYNIAMEGYVGRLNLAAQFSEQSESIEESSDNMTASITNMRGALDGISEGGRSIESLGHALTQLSDNKGWQGFGNIVAGAGQAVQAYMQLATAAEIAATAQAATETPTLWGKIAAITAMVGAFASMVSQVRSMSSYAEGGVVPGRNWNDGITARVSSGEMVINEADQKRLYDSIHNGNMGGGGGPAVVTGEQIVLAVNNYGRRTNRGELVFAGR